MTLQDSPRYLSGEYDYEVVGGDAIYYHNYPDVSSTNNLGSVTSGNFLARAVPSWVVSAGTSYIAQRERSGTTDPSLVEPADGAGSFYNAATRTFEMVTPTEAEGGPYDVRDYGATGDGSTDDTAAIQAAMDACDAAGGGTVAIPVGTYLVDIDYDNGLAVPGNMTIEMQDGAVLTCADSVDDSNGYLLKIDATNCAEVVVRGGEFRGPTTWHASQSVTGLGLYGTDDVVYPKIRVEGARFVGLTYGIRGKGNPLVVTDCTFDGEDHGDDTHRCMGIHCNYSGSHARELVVERCTFTGLGDDGVGPSHSIYVHQSVNLIVRDSQFYENNGQADNYYVTCHSTETPSFYADYGIVEGCYFGPIKSGATCNVAAVRGFPVGQLRVRDCVFECPAGVWPTGDAIIEGCTFRCEVAGDASTPNTISELDAVTGTPDPRYLTVRDCVFDNDADAASFSIYVNPDTGGHATVENCTFKDQAGTTFVNIGDDWINRITGNKFLGDREAIRVAGASNRTKIDHNVFQTTNTHNIRLAGTSVAYLGLYDNDFSQSNAALTIGGGYTPVVLAERNNYGSAPPTYIVASAATIAVGDIPYVAITGTADITSITASVELTGAVVTLTFFDTAASSGLVDGSNLKLASTLAYTPNDTITLICNGTNWYEVARSVN